MSHTESHRHTLQSTTEVVVKLLKSPDLWVDDKVDQVVDTPVCHQKYARAVSRRRNVGGSLLRRGLTACEDEGWMCTTCSHVQHPPLAKL